MFLCIKYVELDYYSFRINLFLIFLFSFLKNNPLIIQLQLFDIFIFQVSPSLVLDCSQNVAECAINDASSKGVCYVLLMQNRHESLRRFMPTNHRKETNEDREKKKEGRTKTLLICFISIIDQSSATLNAHYKRNLNLLQRVRVLSLLLFCTWFLTT